MERKSSIGMYVLLVLILASIIGSVVAGGKMLDKKLKKMDATLTELSKANEEKETKEDDVLISGQYTIKSTKHISDAYKKNDDSDLSKKDKKTLEMAKKVLDEIIKDGMTDYEKELAVYEWIVSNITGGNNSLLTGNNAEAVSTPNGVLRGHNAVCVGYATTFRMFMQMLDIECKVVHNTEEYHSWNEVKLDNEWYFVDCYSDAGNKSYANFNMNDETCLNGHQWDREYFPAAVGTKYNYAVLNAEKCEDIYKIPKMLRKALEKGCKSLFLNIGKDDDDKKAIVLNAMYQQTMNRVSEFGDVTFSMMEADNGDKILTITSTAYGAGGEENNGLSDEEQEKLDKAMEKAFDGFTGEGMTNNNANNNVNNNANNGDKTASEENE